MERVIQQVRCLNVVAQVSLGYYDAEGNLIGEELFPQVDGNVLTAKLFHPHPEQLARLIETCVEQAWAKQAMAAGGAVGMNGAEGVGAAARDGAEVVAPGSEER